MLFKHAIVSFLLLGCSISLLAQPEIKNITATILHEDSLFWLAYNNCDTAKFKQFFTQDVEFYHDKGGLTQGIDNMVLSMKKGLCGNDSFRIRREAVAETVKVYPLTKSNNIYAAIISGDHLFYIWGKGKQEKLDGLAKFMDLWLLKDGTWKMARIISYDHGPASPERMKKK
jgi:uncharacterized protein DUF4440